jgi:hypothetical protein
LYFSDAQTVQVVKPKPQKQQVTYVVQPQHQKQQVTYVVQPQHQKQQVTYTVQHKQSTCTGTKLCMMTCKSRYVLGAKGRDGCNTCTCIPGEVFIKLFLNFHLFKFLAKCAAIAWQ